MDRKRFIGYGAATLAGSMMPGIKGEGSAAGLNGTEEMENEQRGSHLDMIRESFTFRKIDLHNHINTTNRTASMIDESCERLGIDWTACSNLRGDTSDQLFGNTREEMRGLNDVVLDGMRQYPDRILGSCFVNPGLTKESLEEIERCVDQGMVMVGEQYDSYKINDPVYYPIIEKCIDLNVPMMMHAVGTLGNWRPDFWRHGDNPMSTSNAEDFIDVSERYPEAMIICGHVGGGGDWEHMISMLREAPTIYMGTSGSVCDDRMIDMAVEYLGADRVLYSTDVNYENSVGKIMDADLTDEERKMIFFDNFNNLLKPAGNNVN
ncbi:MAG: amidohydrolase family protein [Balneolaceae bacterium]